ncbi:MAG: hypothetical protein ABIE03_07250 [Patescibacteria group bacterium]|nr:hypothetical protein [Patescibacteria group bacterium]
MDIKYRNSLVKKFSKLGISAECTSVYLELWGGGILSVVQLSKRLSMGRNKIYRLLEELEGYNLVSQKEKQHGSEYEALHYRNLQLIIDKKKEEYKKAERGLEDLFDDLPYLKGSNAVSSKVIHYHGLDGLKQVNWNLVYAKGMFRVFEVSRLSSYLEEDFAEKLRLEWLKRKVYTRDLTNDKEVAAHTNVTEFTTKYSEYKYIDPKILKIETEIYIYNDTVSVLEYDSLKYDPRSIFCVEIHNPALARAQMHIYDIIWKQAKLLKIVPGEKGKRGTRKL